MNQIVIYEPPMCCSTGLCGPSIDPELLRVATVINKLKSQGASIERHNLRNNPKAFVQNLLVRKALNEKGSSVLPITMVNGKIVKTGAYLTNEEFIQFTGITVDK